MKTQGNPQDGINGGVTIGYKKSPYSSGLHTEVNTILEAFGTEGDNYYMGVMKLLYLFNELAAPLISATELEKAVMYVPRFGATLTYEVPHEIGLPFLKEVLVDTTVSKPGYLGAFVGIVLSEDCYTNHDVLTDDFRNGVELKVHPTEPVTPYNGGFLYYVSLASNDPEAYISWKHLQVGSRWVKTDNPSGEFDSNYTGLDCDRVGKIMLSYQTGNTEIQVGHSITSYADMMNVSALANYPNAAIAGGFNSSLSSPDAITNYYNLGPDGKPVKGTLTWMPTIIQRILMNLAELKERRMMWSKGYSYRGATGTINRVPTGYYQWIKQHGNYQTYTEHSQLPNILKNIVGTLFSGRKGMNPLDRKVKFRMGMGAIQTMQKEFMTQFKADNPFLIVNDGNNPNLKGLLEGDVQNLKYKPMRIISVQYPEVGIVEIEHEKALDYIDEKFEFQSFQGQLPNSSYMVFVEDLSADSFSNAMPAGGFTKCNDFNNGTNIVQIKPQGYEDTLNFLIGTNCTPTLKKFVGYSPTSKVVSTKAKGFEVIGSTAGEIYVKDPSRTVLIEYKPYV